MLSLVPRLTVGENILLGRLHRHGRWGGLAIDWERDHKTSFLVQADLIPSLANPLWNSSRWLDNSSLLGRFLHTLIGYDAMPSGIQVVFYSATLFLILSGMRYFRRPPPTFSTS